MELIAEGEDILRKYLLGLLTTEQQTPLEERLLTDSAFCEHVSIAEDELIDQYLSGGLTSADRERFERHFLLAPERQGKLLFARMLRHYVVAEDSRGAAAIDVKADGEVPDPSPRAPGRWDSFKRVFARSPGLAFPIAVGLLLCLAAVSWFAVNRLRGTSYEPRNVYAVALGPGLVREGGQITRVAIPAGADTLQLRIAIPTADYPSYSVSLSTTAHADLWTEDELKPTTSAGENLILVNIPALVLGRDDYIVRLRGRRADGGSEEVSRYTFRVVS